MQLGNDQMMRACDGSIDPVLAATNIVKAFSGFKALDDVSLSIHGGEVHGLMGENGAGKSTLIKILTGFYQPDSGEITINGSPARFSEPRDSQNAGVSAVYQEINLIPERSVAENISLGHEPRKLGLIDRKAMASVVRTLLRRYGINVPATAPLRTLGLGQQQMVAIARALALGARVVILDEPTSALSGVEVDLLFNLVRRLKEDGVGILFVSHKLSECYALCDRLSVLRDGRMVLSGTIGEIDKTRLVSAMLGRDRAEATAEQLQRRKAVDRAATPVLRVSHLHWRQRVRDVSFQVHAGEIVGLVGLLGSGRTETFKVVYGAEPLDQGEVCVVSQRASRLAPSDSIAMGITFLPEDRRSEGIFPGLSIRENLAATVLPGLGRFGFVSSSKQNAVVEEFMRTLSVKSTGPQQPIAELSGGNQQKVLLARCLATRPKVVLLDDPTRGIDIGSKSEVHSAIGRLAVEGLAVMITSSEVEELLMICDRLIVINEGRITGELNVNGATPEDLLRLLAAQPADVELITPAAPL